MADKGTGSLPCAGCVYYASHTQTCDYILMTGSRRPCPAGKGCTAKTTERMNRDMSKKRTWDTGRAMELYDAGASDLEIADAVGATEAAVAAWRNGLGLVKRRGPRALGVIEGIASAAGDLGPALMDSVTVIDETLFGEEDKE